MSMKDIGKILKMASLFEALAAAMPISEAEKILGLHHGNYDNDSLSKTYKRKVFLFHPDVNKSPDATEQMKKINVAFETLKHELSFTRHVPVENYSYEPIRNENKEKSEISFEVSTFTYFSDIVGRSYRASKEEQINNKYFTSIKEAIQFINKYTELNKNLAFVIELQHNKRPSTGPSYLVIGFVKYDHVDGRWYAFEKDKKEYEDPEQNPYRSWDEVSQELLNKYGKVDTYI